MAASGRLPAAKFGGPHTSRSLRETPFVNREGETERVAYPNHSEMVGETGFEPATLCSQSRCATRLRHSPTPVSSKCYFEPGQEGRG
jgi:hypothetical protein